MGNKSSAEPKSEPARVHRSESYDYDDDDDDDKLDKEAEMFMTLRIFHELPGGTTKEHKLTVNPSNYVYIIKDDLSKLLNIPKENIKIYRHQKPGVQLPDNSTLRELNVKDNLQLRVRDSRHRYSTPIGTS